VSEVKVTQADENLRREIIQMVVDALDAGNGEPAGFFDTIDAKIARHRQSATTEALAAMEQAREALSAFTMCARYQPHMGGEASFKGWAQNDLREAEAKARATLATLTEQIERMRGEAQQPSGAMTGE